MIFSFLTISFLIYYMSILIFFLFYRTDSIINIGDTVNILNTSLKKNIVDNESGFLVVNPDFLISSTAVVSTLFCMRKAVLNHILPQWSPGNNIMLIGSLVHDIFQKVYFLMYSSYTELNWIF